MAARLLHVRQAELSRLAAERSLLLHDHALERGSHEGCERDHVAHVGERDVGLAVIAVQEQHRAPADDQRHEQDHARGLSLQILGQALVDAFLAERHQLEGPSVLGVRERAREIERNAYRADARAVGARSVRVAAFGDVALDGEQRGILEVLGDEVEERRDQVVARVGFEQILLRGRRGVRTAMALPAALTARRPGEPARRLAGLGFDALRRVARDDQRRDVRGSRWHAAPFPERLQHRLARRRRQRRRRRNGHGRLTLARRPERRVADGRDAGRPRELRKADGHVAHRRGDRARAGVGPPVELGDEPQHPAIERHAVVARERLANAHQRRDLLRDARSERE